MFCNGVYGLGLRAYLWLSHHIYEVRIIFSGQPSINRSEHPYPGLFILFIGPKKRCDALIHCYFAFVKLFRYLSNNYFAQEKINILEILMTAHPKSILQKRLY